MANINQTVAMSRYDGVSGEVDARADALSLIAAALNNDPRARELAATADAHDTSALIKATVDVLAKIATTGQDPLVVVDAIRLDMLEQQLAE